MTASIGELGESPSDEEPEWRKRARSADPAPYASSPTPYTARGTRLALFDERRMLFGDLVPFQIMRILPASRCLYAILGMADLARSRSSHPRCPTRVVRRSDESSAAPPNFPELI